jgi:hypothetical protein
MQCSSADVRGCGCWPGCQSQGWPAVLQLRAGTHSRAACSRAALEQPTVQADMVADTKHSVA